MPRFLSPVELNELQNEELIIVSPDSIEYWKSIGYIYLNKTQSGDVMMFRKNLEIKDER